MKTDNKAAAESFLWLQNIIGSCKNSFHFHSADVLIELFEAKYKAPDLTADLKLLRMDTFNNIHSILN